MLQSPDPNLRVVWFRALQGLAETPAGLARLKDLLSGRVTIPGVELRSLDRWNLVTALVAMDDPDAPDFFNSERQRDPSGDGMKYAYAAEAARPDPETKANSSRNTCAPILVPEDWIEQSLFPSTTGTSPN